MCRGRAEVQAAHRRLRTSEPGNGAEHELLMQLRRAAVDRAAHQVRICCLELVRTGDVTPRDPVAKAGGQALDLILHALDEAVELVLVPAAGELARGARVGSVRAYWPSTRKGRSGIS